MSPDTFLPLEVEQKYRVESHERLLHGILELGAVELPCEKHCDTYLQHPCRDLATTGEAFRIRQVNDSSVVTYKGPKQAGHIKIRTEIEIPLAVRTHPDWMQMLQMLGFQEVAQVRKQRRVFRIQSESDSVVVALDDVDRLGKFVEIEAIVRDQATLERVQNAILHLAKRLGLVEPEPRSYLRQLLELDDNS